MIVFQITVQAQCRDLAHGVCGVAQLLEGGGDQGVLQAQPGGHAGGQTLVLAAHPDNNVGIHICITQNTGASAPTRSYTYYYCLLHGQI